jgi:hypothetical protein
MKSLKLTESLRKSFFLRTKSSQFLDFTFILYLSFSDRHISISPKLWCFFTSLISFSPYSLARQNDTVPFDMKYTRLIFYTFVYHVVNYVEIVVLREFDWLEEWCNVGYKVIRLIFEEKHFLNDRIMHYMR